jgi:hypothetical protein
MHERQEILLGFAGRLRQVREGAQGCDNDQGAGEFGGTGESSLSSL